MPFVAGRYAPSPTGLVHLGNARTAAAAWLSARAQGGRFVWRVEDLDGPRTVPGAVEAAMRDLRWLGLDWDEGPGWDDARGAPTGRDDGPHAPYAQSARPAVYADALRRLDAAGRLFPCRRSRRDLQTLASAPHGPAAGALPGTEGLPPYPAAWRPSAPLPAGWLADASDAAIRFRVADGLVCFDDRVQGRVCEDTARDVGDVVLRRRDGAWAYQLAVVVDDLAMGVTEVVRGADLLDSTARQIQLIEALGGAVPAYAHLGLVVTADGQKLSKRDAPLALAALRDAGVPPETVAGWIGHSLGLADTPAPRPLAAFVAAFDWSKVPPGPVVVPDADGLSR